VEVFAVAARLLAFGVILPPGISGDKTVTPDDEKTKMLNERKAFLVLMAIMVTVAIVIAGVSLTILYQTAFEQQRSRLIEVAQSQARLLEAVACFDQNQSRDYPGGAVASTLAQMADAHSQYQGFGKTGEFTLARRDGDFIKFLLSHRHFDHDQPKPVRFDASLAEPMRRALSGQSGTGIALDYRGATVLAAYEPVAVLDLGIVAKIDLAEIRAPFVRAATIVASIGLILMLVGGLIFFRVGDPMVRRLIRSERDLRNVTNLTPVGIYRSDTDGRLTYVNDRWREIMDLPGDAALNDGWINSMHP
jgi:PAS domain-containing protein